MWGIVRVGDRFVLLRRLTGGVYEARPRFRQFGGRMLHGPLVDVRAKALGYPTEAAARAAARVHVDRWTHLDVAA